jgi:hypothetical protein
VNFADLPKLLGCIHQVDAFPRERAPAPSAAAEPITKSKSSSTHVHAFPR